jgi:hypothetical protein
VRVVSRVRKAGRIIFDASWIFVRGGELKFNLFAL